jgi:phospholipase D1/2
MEPRHSSEFAHLVAQTAVEEQPYRRRRLRRILIALACIAVIAGLAVLWLATPLREWSDIPHLVALMKRLGDSPSAPLAMLGAYVVGGLIVVPVNVLIAVTVIVFGPLAGSAYALLGVLVSAFLLYEIGCRLPAQRLRARLDAPLRRLEHGMGAQGVLAIALIRVVPVAPYSVVNVIAGAAHVARVPYLIGTALGMLPGIVMNALFIDRVLAVIERPRPLTWALLALVVAAIVAVALAVRRRILRDAAE